MRPRGEVRMALAGAAARFESGATWRELARSACVGWDAARETVRSMARGGELVVIGQHAAPHSRRPMQLYALAQSMPTEPASAAVEVAASWAEFT